MGLSRRNIRPQVVSREEVIKPEDYIRLQELEQQRDEAKERMSVEVEEVMEKIEEEIAMPEEPIIVDINEDIVDTPPEIVEEDEVAEETEEVIVEEEDIFEEDEDTPDTERRVVCLDTEKHYRNSKEASEDTGANVSAITRCCNGNCKRAGKLRWMYEKDYREQYNK